MTIAETQLGIASLREHLTGTVFLPGDPGWAAEIRHTGGALARSVDATGHATRFQARPSPSRPREPRDPAGALRGTVGLVAEDSVR
jgi:hypothetical protein